MMIELLLLIVGVVLAAFLSLIVTIALDIKAEVRNIRGDLQKVIADQSDLRAQQKIFELRCFPDEGVS